MHKKRVKGFMFKYDQKPKPLPNERRNIHQINNEQNICKRQIIRRFFCSYSNTIFELARKI